MNMERGKKGFMFYYGLLRDDKLDWDFSKPI